MRIVYNCIIGYHVKKNCALLVKLSHKVIVVGDCSHGIQDKNMLYLGL